MVVFEAPGVGSGCAPDATNGLGEGVIRFRYGVIAGAEAVPPGRGYTGRVGVAAYCICGRNVENPDGEILLLTRSDSGLCDDLRDDAALCFAVSGTFTSGAFIRFIIRLG